MEKIELKTDQNNSTIKAYGKAIEKGMKKIKYHKNKGHKSKVDGCLLCHFK